MQSIIRNDAARAAFIEQLYELPLPIEVECRPYKRKRSLSFNGYYFGYVATPLAEHIGQSVEETHRDLCGEFFGWVTKEFNGHTDRKPRRTTTTNEKGERDVLDWEKMSNFVEHAKMIAANMNVPIQMREAR